MKEFPFIPETKLDQKCKNQKCAFQFVWIWWQLFLIDFFKILIDEMYIRATGNISPQKTFGHLPFLTETVEYTGNRLTCVEPDYKEFIDAKLIRRMSRIIQMGVAAAMECLKEAGVKSPDAIVTGTAYGCLEDTGLFLKKMVEIKEELLNTHRLYSIHT